MEKVIQWLLSLISNHKDQPSNPTQLSKSTSIVRKPKPLITREEILMARDREYPLNPQMEDNLGKLLESLNKFRYKYGKPMYVNSGYRPGTYNVQAGGSLRSAHLTCEAADFSDIDRSLTNYIMSNPFILVECGLYMEEPAATPSWVHLQIRPTRSGNRIFRP